MLFPAQADDAVPFDIGAVPLPQALTEFARQAGVEIFFLPQQLEGLKSHPVKGRYSLRDALELLLSSANVSFTFQRPDLIVIMNQTPEPEPKPPPAVVRERPPERAPEPRLMAEIIVTVERREQRLGDVPHAVSAFAGEHLRNAGVREAQDLALVTPGLTMSQVGSAQTTLRGISTSNLNLSGDPGVAFYIDGIYIGRASGQFQEFWDVDRVEVLRGPQGTLYGRNTPGGVVHIVNRGADPEPELSFSADFGSHSGRRFEATAGGELVADTLSARLALLKEDRDGYARNLFTGEGVDDKNVSGARLAMNYTPADSVRADLRLEFLDRDDTGPVFKALEPGFANFIGGTSPFDHPRDINANRPFAREITNYGASLRADWDVDDWTLTSITGWRKNTFHHTGDLDDTGLDAAWFTSSSNARTLQQEFQVTSTHFDRLEWIAGAFLWWEEADAALAFPFPLFGITPVSRPVIDTFSVAGYAQGTYELTGRLHATAGLRYTYDDKDFENRVTLNPGLPDTVVRLSRGDSAWTPRFGLDYSLNDNTLLYVSATRGFKSGGFNGAGIGPSYAPEFLWAYEAGLKTRRSDGRFEANVDAFYYDYSDVQVFQIVQAGSFLVNAAKATVYGGEAQAVVRPVDGLTLAAGLALTKSRFDEFVTFDPILDLRTPGGAGLQDLSGNRLPRTPPVSANASIEYDWPLGEFGGLSLRGDVQYQGQIYFDHFNRERNAQGGFTIYNARVSYEDPSRHLRISLYGRNLGNKVYAFSKFEIPESLGTVLGIVAPPRTWGLEISCHF